MRSLSEKYQMYIARVEQYYVSATSQSMGTMAIAWQC